MLALLSIVAAVAPEAIVSVKPQTKCHESH
jgi:hypothetical protein